jgi:hypothetical protein
LLFVTYFTQHGLNRSDSNQRVLEGYDRSWRETMPRCLDFVLATISCTSNKFGGPLQLAGEVFGETFNADPADPLIHAVPKERKDIFPFPQGL